MAKTMTVLTISDMSRLISALGTNDIAAVQKYAKRLGKINIQVKPNPKLGLASIGSKSPVKMLAKRLPYVGAGITLGGAGYDLYANGDQYSNMQKGEVIGAAVGQVAGAAIGGAIGGAVGSLLGPWGTAIGVGVGAIAGSIFGEWVGTALGREIGSWW